MSERARQVVILGAGGHGRVILDAVLAAGRDTVLGFLDDDAALAGQQILGFPVLGPSAELARLSRERRIDAVALAIGDNFVRRNKFEEVARAGLEPLTVIHPAAVISRFTKLGQGVVIFAGVVVNPGTAVEDNVCINTAASVDHDNRLGAHCHVFPHATLTGGVRVGEFTSIGSGAVVNPYLTVGRFSFVGSGAVVVRDVEEGVVVAGVPARMLRIQPRRPEVAVAMEGR